ncbi:MAG: hypothetical protein CM1200mP2_02620 [Planctomycetaceae bacterium]|nr:MAG: hypothetical protein CM1200mP2_02620 [Planctomycetaceae bacterium]
MGVVRAVFDTSRALETRLQDPAGYIKMLGKKIGRMRRPPSSSGETLRWPRPTPTSSRPFARSISVSPVLNSCLSRDGHSVGLSHLRAVLTAGIYCRGSGLGDMRQAR